MEFSFNDGDNFIRNMVTVKCGGGMLTPPARKLTRDEGLPIDIADLMDDLRVDSDDEEATLERMQRGACAYIERRTGYVLIPGRYQVAMGGWWQGPLEIMRGPLRELVSVDYLDATGAVVEADLSGFHVEEQDRSFMVLPLSTFTQPTLWSEVWRVRLTFEAGFRLPTESGSDAAPELEDGLRTCLTMLVGHYYANRELFAAGKLETLDVGAQGILAAYRQWW